MPTKFIRLAELSIKYKFVLGIVLILTVTILILSTVFIRQSERLLSDALRNKAALLKMNLSVVSVNSIEDNSFTDLQTIINGIAAGDRDIITIFVAYPSGVIVATSDKEKFPKFSKVKDQNILRQIQSRQDIISIDSNRKLLESINLLFRKKLTPEDELDTSTVKEPVGFIYIALDTVPSENAISMLWYYSLMITAGLIAAGTFAAYCFGASMSRPIKALAEDVRIISSGNLEKAVISGRRDEIGSLVSDVDRMRLAIKFLTENLRTAEKKYRTIFENAVEGIFQSSTDGYFISANPAMAKIFGYDSPEELLASVTDLEKQVYVNADDRKKIIETLVKNREIIGFKAQAYRKDRSIIWVSISARTVSHDYRNMLIVEGFMTDITASVEKQRAEREREIAERANQSKSEFLANMSHEIRTPMNAILGFTELLVPLVADGQQKNYLQAIQAGGKSLLTLINDILDLSKIEAGKLEIRYEPVNPYTVFNEIRQIFELRISQKNLEFATEISDDIPQSLLLDEVRLRQVLFNLIGNAVKFTENGYIKLSADRIFTADDRSMLDLLVSVEDTGIGIPPEAQEKIFQAFIQQDGQNTRKYGGTGLGLTISRRLIEMMNGEITLSSEPGKGSVFRIILRNVAASGTVPESERDIQTAAENFIFDQATVLITDDVETNRLLIKAFFDSTEIRSIEAENGQEAVSAAERFMPDLILMDITMPVMDGYGAVKQIRNNEKTKQIPVIALTARAMSQEKEKIISAGFDGYLTKPINRAELFHEISRFLVHSLKEESSEKIPSAATETLSPEVIEKLPEIIGRLENEFTPLWKDICEKQFLDEIENFAARIVKFADEYSLNSLADFGKEVITHCQNCDIENIESVMKSYPKVIGTLNAEGRCQTVQGIE